MTYSPVSKRRRAVARLLIPVLALAALTLASPLSAQAAAGQTDDFERANGPLGSSWTSDRGSWSIASGAALASSSSGNAVATYNALPIAVDFSVSARINIVAGDAWPPSTDQLWICVTNTSRLEKCPYIVGRNEISNATRPNPISASAMTSR